MKLFRLFAGLGLGLLAASSLAGCIAEPTYSAVPEISLKEIKSQRLSDHPRTLGVRDSVTITINYQDGDGDLGLTEAEAKAAPLANTRFAQNFFLNPFVKNASGQYVQLADAGRGLYTVDGYNQRFVHATAAADGHSMPIRGTLTLAYSFGQSYTFPIGGETVEFHVSIGDRAMHESNVLVVPLTFPR